MHEAGGPDFTLLVECCKFPGVDRSVGDDLEFDDGDEVGAELCAICRLLIRRLRVVDLQQVSPFGRWSVFGVVFFAAHVQAVVIFPISLAVSAC